MMRFSRVWLLIVCLAALMSAPAGAQRFSVGLSFNGGLEFGDDLFATRFSNSVAAALRLELLNLIAPNVSLRADIGSDGVAGTVFWRADLGIVVNLTLSAGFALLDYTTAALLARVGLEYRFSSFGVSLEYGLRSTFLTDTPALRSSFVLSALWFFG
jgi:hypothetical protein